MPHEPSQPRSGNLSIYAPNRTFIYDGCEDGDTLWRIRFPDAPEPVAVIRVGPDAHAQQFVAEALLAGVELRAEPEQLGELVSLIRRAAANEELLIPVEDGTLIQLTEEGRQLLGAAASRLEEQGHLPSRHIFEEPGEHVLIPSPGHYAALQDVLARGAFERVEGSAFPRAELVKGGSRGYAELRPITPEREAMMSPAEIDALAERMWEQREELNDQDADTLDAISATWISRARRPSDRVGVYIDDLLQARGLKPKLGGSGRRGGFEREQRAQLWRCLLHLQSVWLDIAEADVVEKDQAGRRRRRTRTLQSRAFLMTDRIGQRRLDGTMDVEAILVTPGEAFGRFLLGAGRQVALLSSKALQYDPVRQPYEKRLARYLSWQWRVGAQRGEFVRTYKARTLLEEIDLEPNERHPSRTRDRLEKALDRLEADRVISAWQYGDDWDESQLPRQGWMSLWLDSRIVTEAPDVIKDAYQRLDQLGADSKPRRIQKMTGASAPAKRARRPSQGANAAAASLGERLRKHRKARGITQLVAAEELGISQAYVAQIERGRDPSKGLESRIEAWIETPPTASD